MANATRYEITFEEMAIALVRHLNINEGLWTIGSSFQFTAKNLATNNKQLRPGFLGVINQMNLVRVTEAVPGLTVDAAIVNPPIAGTMAKGRKAN
ncbi:hypothetical protein [Dyella sp. C9]|uniref:hypothetical protein n=1 Tax=Dyella sp. C9 TaxID=2202154 RepID=UPI000DEEB9C0|nr:hypothetical protein [Dyella sp. C9]